MANDLYKLEITIENCFFKVNRTIIVPHDVRLDACKEDACRLKAEIENISD